ncbi:MADF and BESS domain-containing protein [Pimephales promelas]|uniref:MADF and BESS domain-containing protein n=1 Tax=Pimephales promelas TaxID=90988 RepID=UPI001955F356|nr:MADF and BESS domain-containing protein [Pimephales promelas]KAG1941871.1 transcription factor Adf-1-like [Pimephales promelas]
MLTTMEERLIAAVSDYPELYNSTINSYKDAARKAKAWRAVSLQVEIPEEDCRRRWKSLRDMFIKDKRAEQRRRASGTSHRSWKYSWQMSFLTPFIQSRSLAVDEPEEDRDEEEKEDEEEEEERTAHGNSSFQDFEADHGMLDGSSHYSASGSQGTGRKRKWQMEANEDLEDEMFLFSLLPYLRRLPYAKKSAVKLKIHQLLYEAEFK